MHSIVSINPILFIVVNDQHCGSDNECASFYCGPDRTCQPNGKQTVLVFFWFKPIDLSTIASQMHCNKALIVPTCNSTHMDCGHANFTCDEIDLVCRCKLLWIEPRTHSCILKLLIKLMFVKFVLAIHALTTVIVLHSNAKITTALHRVLIFNLCIIWV